MRNALFCIASICALLSHRISDSPAAEVTLPEGSAPVPIVSQYFPGRVHEFVW